MVTIIFDKTVQVEKDEGTDTLLKILIAEGPKLI